MRHQLRAEQFTTKIQTQTDKIKIVRVAEESTQTENELNTQVEAARVIESKENNAIISKTSSKYHTLTMDYLFILYCSSYH